MWERLKDVNSGRHYFYNDETQVTQWEFPEDFLLKILNENKWDKATTSIEGVDKIYYFNQETNESSWNIPEIVLRELKDKFGDDLTQDEIHGEEIILNDNQSQSMENKGENKEEDIVENDQFVSNNNENEINEKNNDEIKGSIINQLIGLDQLIQDKDEKDQIMEIEGDPKVNFMNMLKQFNFSSKTQFKEVISKCINDSRYWNIDNPIERNTLFEMYQINKSEEEFEFEKQKYRDEYFKILAKNNVKYYTRWNTYYKNEESKEKRENIGNDDIKSNLSDKVKYELFIEYTTNLRKEKEESINKNKSIELESLENELKETVTLSTEFLKIINVFQDKYKSLNKIEILNVFEKVMIEVENKQINQVKIENYKNYRSDRKARYNFKKLIKNMIDNKEMNVNSQFKWFQFINLIKDKPEFLELCGHHGSTVIDYYWDLLNETYIKLNNKKELIKQILINANVKINDITENEFIKIMKGSDKEEISKLCDDDLKTLYKISLSLNPSVKRSAGETNEFESGRRKKILLRKNM